MNEEWWKPDSKADKVLDKKERAAALLSETSKIEERQHAWYELNLWNSTLYNNRTLPNFRWGADDTSGQELWPENLRTENIVENIGQAMLSKASSSPIKPTLVPHGNSWRAVKAIRRGDRFTFGAWRQTKSEKACVDAFNDMYTSGLGCVAVSYNDKCLHVEPVLFDNIVIDDDECMNRAMPKTPRIRKMMRACDIKSRYDVELGPKDDSSRYNSKRRQGKKWHACVEAWYLPDYGKKNGRHVMAIEGYDDLVVDEPWEHDRAPLVFTHWQPRQSGMFVKGGVEQVLPFQVLQNELNDDIREAQDLACRMRILAHLNSNLDMSAFDNANGRIIYYSGTEPKPFETKTNLAELYQERERNKAAAYSHVGMSESFAGADVSPGNRLDSSAAVREQRNMEDSRHLTLWTAFERFRLDVAETLLFVLSISKGAENYRAPAGSRYSAEEIPYKDVQELLKLKYSWTMEATPIAMMSPAARRELLRDYTSRGASEQGMPDSHRMTGQADVEMLEDLELADKEDIERHLGLMENGIFPIQDEFTNLSLGLMMVKANMKRLLQYDDLNELSPEVELHRRWMTTAASTLASKEKMAQMQQMQMQAQAQMQAFAPTQGVAGTSAAQPAQQ